MPTLTELRRGNVPAVLKKTEASVSAAGRVWEALKRSPAQTSFRVHPFPELPSGERCSVREAECAYITGATIGDFLQWDCARESNTPVRALENPFSGLGRDAFWAYCDYKESAELFPPPHGLADSDGNTALPTHRDQEEWAVDDPPRVAVSGRPEPPTPDDLDSTLFSWESLVPGCAAEGKVRGILDATVWVGSKGAHSALHYDTYGVNIVLQVRGAKLWRLWRPECSPPLDQPTHDQPTHDHDHQQFCRQDSRGDHGCFRRRNLRPTRVPYEESSVFSKVDVGRPSSVGQGVHSGDGGCSGSSSCAFSSLSSPSSSSSSPSSSSSSSSSSLPSTSLNNDGRARSFERSFECLLREGEVLFVPRHWWHDVECASDEPSASVNAWLEATAPAAATLPPSATSATATSSLLPCPSQRIDGHDECEITGKKRAAGEVDTNRLLSSMSSPLRPTQQARREEEEVATAAAAAAPLLSEAGRPARTSAPLGREEQGTDAFSRVSEALTRVVLSSLLAAVASATKRKSKAAAAAAARATTTLSSPPCKDAHRGGGVGKDDRGDGDRDEGGGSIDDDNDDNADNDDCRGERDAVLSSCPLLQQSANNGEVNQGAERNREKCGDDADGSEDDVDSGAIDCDKALRESDDTMLDEWVNPTESIYPHAESMELLSAAVHSFMEERRRGLQRRQEEQQKQQGEETPPSFTNTDTLVGALPPMERPPSLPRCDVGERAVADAILDPKVMHSAVVRLLEDHLEDHFYARGDY